MTTVAKYRRRDGVVARSVGGELVLMPVSREIRTGGGVFPNIYVLNETAAILWDALAQPATPAELARCLTEHFEVSLERAQEDVDHLLRDLAAHGVIVTAEP